MTNRTAKDDAAIRKIVSNITYLDLAELIDRVNDHSGRYQVLVLVFLSFNSLICSINESFPAVYGAVPENFTCENFSCVSDCGDHVEKDIVSEWVLYCDAERVLKTAATIYVVGMISGSLICGTLCDIWGRRTVMLVSLYVQGVLGIALYFSTTLLMFNVLRFLQSFFIQGLQISYYTLLMETSPEKKRTTISFLGFFFWAGGTVLLGVLTYFIPSWRGLQLAITIPTVLTLLWFWIIPESPKWFLVQNRKLEAMKALAQSTETSKLYPILKEYNLKQLDQRSISSYHVEVLPEKETPLHLFKNRHLRKNLLIMVILWFAVNVAYWNLQQYLPSISEDRHLNLILGGMIEFFGATAGYFGLSSSIGRRFITSGLMYAVAVVFVALGVLPFLPDLEFWQLCTVGMVGKLIVSTVLSVIFLYTAEVFPTTVRASAFGLLGVASSIGILFGPEIEKLAEVTFPVASVVVIAVLVFLGGSLAFWLPETLNKSLPNAVHDVWEWPGAL